MALDTSAFFATPQGTKRFFEQHNIHPEKLRTINHLRLSGISMGTCSGAPDEITDQAYINAIVLGVTHGINAIDTASSYRQQRSEKLLKRALPELRSLGITREQLIISSKAGLIPDHAASESHEGYIRSHYVERGILRQNDILHGFYSMAPKFIAEEIHHSLENMGLSCIDIYYINLPELINLHLGKEEFDKRIYAAFEVLEEKVAEEKIRSYGVATWNGFRQKAGTKGLLDLEGLCRCAEMVAGSNHHFSAIQLPFNMVMLEVVKTKNQTEDKTIAEVAQEKGIHVMICSPLMESRVLSLPKRIFDQMPKELSPSMQALQFTVSYPWVSSVVVGMKAETHVHENIKVLQRPNWSLEHLEKTTEVLGL
ncbi:MAG: aldo/keto reductase [Chlamydiota bacterium]